MSNIGIFARILYFSFHPSHTHMFQEESGSPSGRLRGAPAPPPKSRRHTFPLSPRRCRRRQSDGGRRRRGSPPVTSPKIQSISEIPTPKIEVRSEASRDPARHAPAVHGPAPPLSSCPRRARLLCAALCRNPAGGQIGLAFASTPRRRPRRPPDPSRRGSSRAPVSALALAPAPRGRPRPASRCGARGMRPPWPSPTASPVPGFGSAPAAIGGSWM